MTPVVLIRPILSRISVNHSAPSGPEVMPWGTTTLGMRYSVKLTVRDRAYEPVTVTVRNPASQSTRLTTLNGFTAPTAVSHSARTRYIVPALPLPKTIMRRFQLQPPNEYFEGIGTPSYLHDDAVDVGDAVPDLNGDQIPASVFPASCENSIASLNGERSWKVWPFQTFALGGMESLGARGRRSGASIVGNARASKRCGRLNLPEPEHDSRGEPKSGCALPKERVSSNSGWMIR